MWVSFRKFREQMTESCYPSVPLSLQFNYALPLYSLSFQSYHKRENNQGVNLSLKKPQSNHKLYHHHSSCFVLLKVRCALSQRADLYESYLLMLRFCILMMSWGFFPFYPFFFFFFLSYCSTNAQVQQIFSGPGEKAGIKYTSQERQRDCSLW